MLSIKNLVKAYEEHQVLRGISFSMEEGEVISIIGPSGGGKSTILRCINGLDSKTSGIIDMSSLKATDIGMVFQSFNLFNNMSVIENVKYALIHVHGYGKQQSTKLANAALEKVGMSQHKNKVPIQLSGGQKQRVAIARTIACAPKLILFDEPTSALDPENVKEVLETIKKLAKEKISMLIVTHEMKFARDVSDRIMFLDHGKILELTPTKQFFSDPTTARAKKFLREVMD